METQESIILAKCDGYKWILTNNVVNIVSDSGGSRFFCFLPAWPLGKSILKDNMQYLNFEVIEK